jgi:hypothetical protein
MRDHAVETGKIEYFKPTAKPHNPGISEFFTGDKILRKFRLRLGLPSKGRLKASASRNWEDYYEFVIRT